MRGWWRRRRRGVGKTTLVLWFVAMTVVSGGLLASHLLAMPVPSKTLRLGHRLQAFLDPRAPNRWLAVHVLSSECPCSLRVVAHLLETTRPQAWTEIILWVGDLDPPTELTRRFDLRRVTTVELASYEIEGAPLLLAVTPAGEVRYAGGYTDRKQGPVFHDLDVLAAALVGTEPSTLPLFGCATSDRLRRILSRLPTP